MCKIFFNYAPCLYAVMLICGVHVEMTEVKNVHSG